MILSTFRSRFFAHFVFAAFIFVCSVALGVNPTPRGSGPGIPSPTSTPAKPRSAAPPGSIDEKLFQGMQWRQIGPFRGGRALAIEGVPGEPDTYYFGAVAGGVWKTVDGGQNLTPLFDQEEILSIRATAAPQSDHKCVF